MKENASFWISLLCLAISLFVFTVALIHLITGKLSWVHNSNLCIVLASLTILTCIIQLSIRR